MSNIGAVEAFCETCGVIFMAKNRVRVIEERDEHIEKTGHSVTIRTYYHR